MIDDFCKRLVARHPASDGRAHARVLDQAASAVPSPHPAGGDPPQANHQPPRPHRPLAIGRTRHHFHCLRLWELDAEPLLADPALLPLAVLARPADPRPEQLLLRVRQRLQTIADADQRRTTTTGCQLLAGLAFTPDVIQRLLAMSILEDSSVSQLIVRKGLEEGRRDEAATLLLRQLECLCGPLSDAHRAAIRGLPIDRLEQLGDAVLDFRGQPDLIAWLECS